MRRVVNQFMHRIESAVAIFASSSTTAAIGACLITVNVLRAGQESEPNRDTNGGQTSPTVAVEKDASMGLIECHELFRLSGHTNVVNPVANFIVGHTCFALAAIKAIFEAMSGLRDAAEFAIR